MACFLGSPDEETALLHATSPTRVQGKLPGRGLVNCFKGTPSGGSTSAFYRFFRRLHRTAHHRSLVFSDGVGHRCPTLFCGVS